MTARWGDDRGPRVLVAFGSRHGGTREIAAALALGLMHGAAGRRTGLRVALVSVEQRPDPAGFDAVVLGSPLYEGHWLAPVVDYSCRVTAALGNHPTWLFTSGLGSGPSGRLPDVHDPRWIGACIGARGHRFLPGRLEDRLLSPAERRAWRVGPGGGGDLRDWAAVRGWSEEIAAELGARHAVPVGA